jgi:hypothetical protein
MVNMTPLIKREVKRVPLGPEIFKYVSIPWFIRSDDEKMLVGK